MGMLIVSFSIFLMLHTLAAGEQQSLPLLAILLLDCCFFHVLTDGHFALCAGDPIGESSIPGHTHPPHLGLLCHGHALDADSVRGSHSNRNSLLLFHLHCSPFRQI